MLKLLLQKQFLVNCCFMIKRQWALTCVCCHFAFHEKYSENGIFIFWIGKTLLAFNSDCGCYISLFSCILKNGILYPHLLGDNGRSFKLFLDADLRKLSVHLCFSSIWKKNTTSVSHSIACILYNTASARWSHDPLPETAAWPCLLLQATVMCMGLFAVRWSMTYSGVKKANKETTAKTKNNISATFFFFLFCFFISVAMVGYLANACYPTSTTTL